MVVPHDAPPAGVRPNGIAQCVPRVDRLPRRHKPCHGRHMAQLVVITGPITAGKNTVASVIADRLSMLGRSGVLVDVDDVAAMVAAPGAAALGLWFAAHQAHGALVARWMQTAVDVVIAVGHPRRTSRAARTAARRRSRAVGGRGCAHRRHPGPSSKGP
jgi:adenylylsulfate kinase-like enzyme